RSRLGFFHHWCADGLTFFHQLKLAMFRKAGSGRNQVTHDHVFFEAAQPVDLAERSCFSEHAGGILERSRVNKAVGFERSLGDAEQHRNSLRRLAAFLDNFLVLFLEVEFVDLIAPEQRCIAWIGDLYLPQHLAHDDFDVLVIDLHALESIDLLHFIHQVLLQLLWTAHFENLVWHNGTFGQLLAFLHVIAFKHNDVLRERNEMFFLSPGVRVFENQTPLAAYRSTEFDNTIDLGDLSGVLWPTSFEQLRNSRKTTGDILGLCNFTWRLRQQCACAHFLPFLHDDVSPCGN